MNKHHLISLIIMSIFAALFLISFTAYRTVKNHLFVCETELRAMKPLVKGDIPTFQNLMKKLGKESDMSFYIDEFVKMEINRGRIEMENENFGRAYEHFLNAYEMAQKIPLKLRAAYFCGKALNRSEEFEKAFQFLRVFLEEKGYGFSKDALIELAIAAKNLKESKTLTEIEKLLQNDPVYYKKLEEVEK